MVTKDQIEELHQYLTEIHVKAQDKNLIDTLFGEKADNFSFYEKSLFIEDKDKFIEEINKNDDFFNQYIRQLRIMYSYFQKPISPVTKLYMYRNRDSACEGALEYSKIISSSMCI